MENGQAALLFLYGLFWAEMLATSARYNGFPTAKLWNGSDIPGERSKWFKRLAASFIILNLLLIVWLLFLYGAIVPPRTGLKPIAVAALSSLSIFGIIRLYHGLVASRHTVATFFTDAERQALEVQGPSGRELSVWAHVVPGLAYLVLLTAMAWGVNRLF